MVGTKALWLISFICRSYKIALAVILHKVAPIIWSKSQIHPLLRYSAVRSYPILVCAL